MSQCMQSKLCSLEWFCEILQWVETVSILTSLPSKRKPRHVDTTLCPSDEMMWLQTTLVFRDGKGWEVDEYCESVSELQHNLEEELVYPEQVVEVITLAHKHAMKDEYSGFFFNDRPPDRPENFQEDEVVSNAYSAGSLAAVLLQTQSLKIHQLMLQRVKHMRATALLNT